MYLGNRGRLAVAAVSSSVVAVSMLGLPSQAAEPPGAGSGGSELRAEASRTPGYVDVRQLATRAAVRADTTRLERQSRSDTSFQRSLGAQAAIDYDPLTGTPRSFGRLDGYLSGRSSAPARDVALGFVRQHLSVLGLAPSDLSTLRFSRDYVDTFGLHHLSWTQEVAGTSVFGNGLEVNVTSDGRVLSVQGSPVSGLAKLAAAAPRASGVDAATARSRAARDVGGRAASSPVASNAGALTRWANDDYASEVWFLTPSGLRRGWSTYVQPSGAEAYQHVVDAASGAVLYRRSTVDHADGDGKVYDYYPGAPSGGKAKVVNFFRRGWLQRRATFLNGDSVIAWSDVNDDNAINRGEKTPVPGTPRAAQFTLTPFGKGASSLCSRQYVCTWNPDRAGSWTVNRRADVTNAFYLGSNFHDYLEKAPFSFTTAAGNFSASGGDPVLLNALDGADTADGLPDGSHIDNANMSTPPDGTPPTMQMYLFHQPGTTAAQEPYLPTSSSFDASVLYHEYTHGLSNRLVVDADGNSTLNGIQAGSMGEAWSDYYAMDYLEQKRFVKDTSSSGEVLEGKYLVAGRFPFRTMAIDCAVSATAKNCTDQFGRRGGYTYGDFSTVIPGPEVHASGEIWAQALWDLRRRLGHRLAGGLITRAMSLSANDPDFLDMRNAILQADLVGHDGAHRNAIWETFARRGMGYFAGSIDSADTQPAEDFELPPSPATRRTSISGTVTDPTTGDPVEGALVQVTGRGDQFSDTTDAAGRYAISGLYQGTYRKVVASAPGYFPDAQPVNTRTSGAADFEIIRDWAARSGGARISDFSGPDYSPQCGPDGAIDLSLSSGWGSTTGDDNGTPTNTFVPKHITVDMRRPIAISSIGVDPNATCGDGGSASTGRYRIETSMNGTSWTTAATGEFTPADRGHLNELTPAAGSATARYVRFTMLSNQTPDFATNCPNGAYSGCSYTDLSELAVFGDGTP